MWTKSPVKSFVHVSIKPLFPAVPNFCRVQACKIHLLLWSPGGKKSLSKDLKEKIVAVDRMKGITYSSRKTLCKKVRLSWTVCLLKWWELIYKFEREVAFISFHLIVWNFFPVFFFKKETELSCQKPFLHMLGAFKFMIHPSFENTVHHFTTSYKVKHRSNFAPSGNWVSSSYMYVYIYVYISYISIWL